MSNAQDHKQALLEHKVIPSVLPTDVNLPYNLKLKWPNTTLNTPGQELNREETQSEPTVYLDPPVRSLFYHLRRLN